MWDGEVERKDGQRNTKNGEGKRRKQRERHIYKYIYIEQVQLLAGAADSKADAGQPCMPVFVIYLVHQHVVFQIETLSKENK